MANTGNDGAITDTNQGADVRETPSIAYKPKRRGARQGKGNSKQKVAVTKRPVKLMLETDVYEAMVITGLRSGENLSQLVSNLVRTHLTRWVVHSRPGPRSEAS